MSRLKRFAHSLASGYLLMAANAVYTFVSIPLALHYLPKAEFGLWALALQVAGYVGLLDLGASGASARLLIDFKDRRAGGEYGGVVQTHLWVHLSQAAIIFLIGILISFVTGPLLKVPLDDRHTFFWLMIGQCAVLAGNFVLRIFGTVLSAHQRYDLGNYGQILFFVVALPVLWIELKNAAGVFSLLWAQVAGSVACNAEIVLCAILFGYMPRRGEWGKPAWQHFGELFGLGRDVFLLSIGNLLVNASQTIVITRVLGLEANAIWIVCTRVFNMALTLIYRIYDFSFGAFAEMFAKGDMDRLNRRFRSIVVLSCSLAVLVGALFATCNRNFVELWTHGKVTWPRVNDLLLGFWLVAQVVAHCHIGLIGVTKKFRFLRWIYFIEGAFFIVCSIPALKFGGITGMLIVSTVGTLCISLQYGISRSSQLFRVTRRDLLIGWLEPSLRLTALLVVISVGAILTATHFSQHVSLILTGTGVSLLGAGLLWGIGLERDLKQELRGKFASFTHR